MADAFTVTDYLELHGRLKAAKDDDVTAILSNNFNVVLGALHAAIETSLALRPAAVAARELLEQGRVAEGGLIWLSFDDLRHIALTLK